MTYLGRRLCKQCWNELANAGSGKEARILSKLKLRRKRPGSLAYLWEKAALVLEQERERVVEKYRGVKKSEETDQEYDVRMRRNEASRRSKAKARARE